MAGTLNDLKITDIIYCEHKSKCKWKGFALDGNGYGIGRVENYLQTWRDWHEKECGGKLIQAVIVKEDFLSTILVKVDSAGLTDEKMYHMVQDYGWGKDTEERGFILSIMDITSQTQLQAVKEILK
jgi:hypothetical protein